VWRKPWAVRKRKKEKTERRVIMRIRKEWTEKGREIEVEEEEWWGD